MSIQVLGSVLCTSRERKLLLIGYIVKILRRKGLAKLPDLSGTTIPSNEQSIIRDSESLDATATENEWPTLLVLRAGAICLMIINGYSSMITGT